MNATRVLDFPSTVHARLAARLESHAEPADRGCIVWTGALDRYGYGRFPVRHNGKRVETSAHRAAWIIRRGRIEGEASVIDHLCRNRRCVNVKHMELVTNAENVRRGATMRANRAALGLPLHRRNKVSIGREVCANGHPWQDGSAYQRKGRDGYLRVECRECRRDRMNRYRERCAA